MGRLDWGNSTEGNYVIYEHLSDSSLYCII